MTAKEEWGASGAWTERLRTAGLSGDAASRVSRSFAEAARHLEETSGAPDFAFFVPGRIEVLGKHTDYAGGRSLLAALEWGFAFVGRGVGAEQGVEVVDAQRGRTLRMALGSQLADSPQGWALYPTTVMRRLARDFPDASGGVCLAFASDLPPASGMSSSSALVTGTLLSLAAGLDLGTEPGLVEAVGFGPDHDFEARDRLAAYMAAVEAGVGTAGGSEDHIAILSSRPGRLVQYGFHPVRFEGETSLPSGWTFVVASSGVRAEKAGGARRAYNRLSEEVETTARIWREETDGGEPHLAAILARSGEARARMERILEEEGHTRLLSRFRQFAIESGDLVPGTLAALAAGDLDTVGDLVAHSQGLAEEVLGNQVPETTHLVASARTLGAPAASAFGAGFGGAVWALVREEEAEGFLAAWRAAYVARFPQRRAMSAFLRSKAGPSAFRLL